jgi:hypothetical protein
MPCKSCIVIKDLRVGNLAVNDATKTIDMGGSRVRNVGGPDHTADAATKEYVDASRGGSQPGGAPDHIQYHEDGGAFAGDADFTWDASNKVFAVSGVAARVVIGAQAADAGAVLQLKTQVETGLQPVNAGPPPTQMSSGPSRSTYQSSARGSPGALVRVLTLTLADQSAAYFDVVATARMTGAAALSDIAVTHMRFTAMRNGATVTVGAVTTDFLALGKTKAVFSVGVNDTNVEIRCVGGSDTYTYGVTSVVDVLA